MIETIPDQVQHALLYFHSAGTSSSELQPFLPDLIASLPNTYIWAGDGVIAGSPLMRQGIQYGSDSKRYWFTFPMQDASSPKSFASHAEAMGAVLTCCGAYINALVDQVMARFGIMAKDVVLCGFQHGGCAALSASMLRLQDPFAFTILFEPYVLEAYYLKEAQTLPRTTVVCIENEFIRARTRSWLQHDTDQVFQSYGMNTRQITTAEGSGALDAWMMEEAIQLMKKL